jgi:hypothetical protein
MVVVAVNPLTNRRNEMTQTVLTLSQMMEWKLNGFVQLDLFPEELEQAKREQDYVVQFWSNLMNREEGETK